MRIELASLEGKEGNVAHAYEPAELSLDEERVTLEQPPKIAGRILRDGARVIVEGEIGAVTRIECDRCLRPIELPVKAQFKVEYVTPEAYQVEQDAELEEEDLALSTFDGETIDVDELVREQVLLEVPAHALCQEDCKGLCPVCGVDRNQSNCNCQTSEIDPRWSGLKDMRF